MKALSGCEEPSQVPVWDNEGDKFYTCPMQFIPQTVCDWYEEYAYCLEIGTTVGWQDRPARWLEALRIYKKHLNIWYEEKAAKSKQERETIRSSSHAKRY